MLKVDLKYFPRFTRFLAKMAQSKTCKVAVCQMTATNNPERNMNVVKTLIHNAREQNAKIVFLPEGCDYIAENSQQLLNLAEPLDGPRIAEYKRLASDHEIWLSIGGVHELIKKDEQEKIYNCQLVINDKGKLVSTYRKLHLFNVDIPEERLRLNESKTVEPGSCVVPPVDTPAGKLGMAICYDLRFPEHSTILRQCGADVIVYPSAFTRETGSAHWEILLRARAIETQCYVVAAAQIGRHNGTRISHGQTMVVSPWGKVIAQCEKFTDDRPYRPTFCSADITLADVDEVRRKMPVYDHRRFDVYGNISEITKYSPVEKLQYEFAEKIIPESTVFYKTSLSYAFTNLRCVVPGHVLVAPIRKVLRLKDLNKMEIADLFQTVILVQSTLDRVRGALSSTVTVQDGEHAGQTVKHVHVHVMPRVPGDFLDNDEIYTKLASHDRGPDKQPARSLEEMTREAQHLKQFFR